MILSIKLDVDSSEETVRLLRRLANQFERHRPLYDNIKNNQMKNVQLWEDQDDKLQTVGSMGVGTLAPARFEDGFTQLRY